MIENKIYYVDLLNSSKANQFTSAYHYSGIGFKKAKINLGVLEKPTIFLWVCFNGVFQRKRELD